MDWSKRVVVRMLLVGMWTLSLFILAFPARAQAQGGEGGIHIVAAGETLSQIARQYDTDVATLLELNGLANANLVYVGQQLVVAGGGGGDQPSGEQSRWNDDETASSGPNDNRQGTGWEPQQSDQPYQRAGVAWEPQGSEEGPSRPEADWEPQDTWEPQRNAEPQGDERNGYRAQEWESQTPQSQPSPYLEDWESVHSERDSYPAGRSWEPQPSVGSGREVDATGEKWIDVDISDQILTAYQGDTVVRFFIISSGSERYPTVTGSFRTYSRTEMQDMSGGSKAAGDYYFQADVSWVQYFFESYAIHGAYWHNRFGTPIGHGCINMRVDESQWLYEWAGVTGIRVEVHE